MYTGCVYGSERDLEKEKKHKQLRRVYGSERDL